MAAALGLTGSSRSPGGWHRVLGPALVPCVAENICRLQSLVMGRLEPLWRCSRLKAALGEWQVGTHSNGGHSCGEQETSRTSTGWWQGMGHIAHMGELQWTQPGSLEGCGGLYTKVTQPSAPPSWIPAPCHLTCWLTAKGCLCREPHVFPGWRRRWESKGISFVEDQAVENSSVT